MMRYRRNTDLREFNCLGAGILKAGIQYFARLCSVGFVYSGYGYGSLTELTEVPGTGMEVLQNSQKFRVGTRMLYPYPYPHPGIFTRAYPYPGYCATGVQNFTPRIT